MEAFGLSGAAVGLVRKSRRHALGVPNSYLGRAAAKLACIFEDLLRHLAFAARQIVEDKDIARCHNQRELRFDNGSFRKDARR